MHTGFKKYETHWSEFLCAGILAINVEAVKSIYTSDLFWVYFSKAFLTDKLTGGAMWASRPTVLG